MRATSMRAGVRPGSAKPERGASSYTSRAPSLRRLYPARSLSLLAALAFALTVVVVLLTAHTGRTVHRTPVVPVVPALKAPPVKASKPPRTHQANAVEAASKPSAHASNPPPEPASKPLDPFCQRRPPLSRVEQRAVKRSTDLALSQWGWCGGATDRYVPKRKPHPPPASTSAAPVSSAGSTSRRKGQPPPPTGFRRRLLESGSVSVSNKGGDARALSRASTTGPPKLRGAVRPGHEHTKIVGGGTWMNFLQTECSRIPLRPVKVMSENTKPDAQPPCAAVQPHEQNLVACLTHLGACTNLTMEAAQSLRSVWGLSERLGSVEVTNSSGDGYHALTPARRYRTCAVVGNAGHLKLRKYGQFIDKHELVLRFNAQSLQGWEDRAGSRTTMRMMNRADSTKACCGRAAEERGLAVSNDTAGAYLLWHPAHMRIVQDHCQRRFPSIPVHGLSLASTIPRWVTALRELRRELLRLGLGPFGNWRQMTSGMHGVLTMLSVCDQVSLYGFTTWPRSMRGGDQYAGNAAKQGSGWMWHDWHGEMHVLRLLHAAGRVSVCSM